MISLAVKYRPNTFDDVVGQTEIKDILQYQVANKTNQNCYLFTGGAGTGKTTCARIFANALNQNKGLPIEIDAASNNGVEQIRQIIEEAKYKSLNSEFKIYILDECFVGNTLVKTPKGNKPIKDICIGDIVNHMTGQGKVTNVFNSSVLTNHLCLVKLNNNKIYTTKNHLFFTNNGWVEACNLKKGDVVYDSTSVFKLQKDVLEQTERSKVLLSSMFCGVQKEYISTCNEGSLLSDLQQKVFGSSLGKDQNVFERMYENSNIRIREEDNEFRVRFGIVEAIFSKNVEKQSNVQFGNSGKDVANEEKERNTSSMEIRKKREWEIYTSSADVMERVRSWLGIGVCSSNKKEASVSYQLQIRYCLSYQKDSDRGGWERPSLETRFIERQEKGNSFELPWVESVEVYKRGYNDELFLDCFTSEELSSDHVKMYDLEVEKDHTYFANDILVHNCHMLSNGAWNAMLKLLEEPPAKTIFIMCTTDPQKIPATILSRVQRFDFQRIPHKLIIERLATIMDMEADNGVNFGEFEEYALDYIAKLANGGMRDAITLLDKCIAYSLDITVDNVVKALGVVNYQEFLTLFENTWLQEKPAIIEQIEKIYMSGKDLKLFMKSYYYFLVDLVCFNVTKNITLVGIPEFLEKDCKCSGDKLNFVYESMEKVGELINNIKWEQNAKPFIIARMITL